MNKFFYEKAGTAVCTDRPLTHKRGRASFVYPVTWMTCGLAASSLTYGASVGSAAILPGCIVNEVGGGRTETSRKLRSNQAHRDAFQISALMGNSLAVIQQQSVLDSVEFILSCNGLQASRKTDAGDVTSFEFLGDNVDALIDVYEDGEIILLIHGDGVRNCYELKVDQLSQLPRLLRDAGF